MSIDLRKQRIIAREGLIVLTFFLLFFIGLFFSFYKVAMIGFFGYPVYLIVRFVIWAVKILRGKESDKKNNDILT